MKSKGKKMKKSPHKWDGRKQGKNFMGKTNNKFHNPYHFVPVGKPVFNRDGLTWLDISKGQGDTRWARLHEGLKKEGLSHDRYHPGRYHGRITCFLETKTPIFIGARRIRDGFKESPAAVAPFELEESPAIPASTLRGMISSVLEAASNSALRVLEKRMLTRRAYPREALGAIGMLVKKEDGQLGLLPLTLPPLKLERVNGSLKISKESKKWKEVFSKYPAFPLYVDGYEPGPGNKITYKNKSFLDREKPKSWSSKKSETWYSKVPKVEWKEEESIYVEDPKKRGRFLIGHKGVVEPQTDPEEGLTRGILRVLGIENREKEIPIKRKNGKIVGKKHEIFIPYPEDESCRNDILDLGDALGRFHMMADERAGKDGKYPFELKGMGRIWIEDRKTLRLRENDLVFFDVKKDADGKYRVSRISISAIWRMECGGTVHDFFKRIDQELLPFSPERKKVSPAELIFGFVEDMSEKPKEGPESALAYAGRVRFSHGLLENPGPEEDPYMDEVTLKILASPKPPCPCMYFYDTENGNRFIAKDMLTNQGDGEPGKYLPKGRKFYLHHNLEKEEEFGRKYNGQSLPPWETHPNLAKPNNKESRLKQKAAVRPVRKGLTFKFHVDFENLDETELALLLYSLSPEEGFWHKIGMGKPIGLGSVEIKVDSVELIDREKRYTKEDPFGPGTTRYNLEHKITEEDFKIIKDDKNFENILKALKQIGNPKNVTQRVHTPLTMSQSGENEEKETFRWFDYNNKHYKKQQLPTLPVEHGPLPLLKRNEKPKKKGR